MIQNRLFDGFSTLCNGGFREIALQLASTVIGTHLNNLR